MGKGRRTRWLVMTLTAFPGWAVNAQDPVAAPSPGAMPGSILIVGAVPPPPGPSGRIEYDAGIAPSAIAVDGVLDDGAWSSAVVIPLPWEVRPARNGPASVATECRLTHDAENLYLGCTAEDPDPRRIRAYITDRDAIGRHDRVELTLDPFNDQRRAFRFAISALGVQSDAVLSQQSANPNGDPNQIPVDPSWDAIWTSAGRITDDGFVVEAAIPFRSLRFPRAGDGGATWGMYLTRWFPRSSNVELRSATWDRGDACVLCQANLVRGIRGGTGGSKVQMTPTLTASRSEERPARGAPLVADPLRRDLGMDVQWGVTSDLTLNLTANPDFSQVEADVAQLDVNNRFALFFPEKRPFFLEGADFFGTPIQAVFTRSIADPRGGAKLTGKLGSNAVGMLVAQDRSNNLLIPGSQSSRTVTLTDEPVTTVARFRRDVGTTSTVGALFTGREGEGYSNRVAGVDGFYRPLPSITLRGQMLGSRTLYPEAISNDLDQPATAFSGTAAQVRASVGTNAWRFSGDLRRIDPDFRADAGFVTQAGVIGGSANLTRQWWGGSGRWFSQLRVEGGAWRNRDFDGNPLNGGLWMGLGYDGPRQTSVGIWPNVFMTEHYGNTTFTGLDQLWFDLRATPTGWASVGLNGNVGDAVDYANERRGSELRLAPEIELRLGRNVATELRHTYQRLSNTEGRVFSAHLSQVRAIYNFSTRSFVRGIVQYRRTDRDPARYASDVDRRSEELLAQVLYAYKLNPQTVLFLGYSQNGSGMIDVDRVRESIALRGRTLFLKLGYAWMP